MKVSIVLTGYHFKYKELYETINQEIKLYNDISFDLYILSHKAEHEIPETISNYLLNHNWEIIYYKNIGWDWGSHSQFMNFHESNNKKSDYILFLHDDLKIVKNGFIKQFLNKINEGCVAVGNSLPFTTINSYRKDYPEEVFILENHGFNISADVIKLIRGSALFTTYECAVFSLNNLPYQKTGNINLANRSLRMFSAVVSSEFGIEKIGYLSEKHFQSDFIVEEMRGKAQNGSFIIKRNIFKGINSIFLGIESLLNLRTSLFRNKNKIGSLKVNLTLRNAKPDYLNYFHDNDFVSDLKIDDLYNLLSGKRVFEILVDHDVVEERKFLKQFLERLSQIIQNEVTIIMENDVYENNIDFFKLFIRDKFKVNQYSKFVIIIDKLPRIKKYILIQVNNKKQSNGSK